MKKMYQKVSFSFMVIVTSYTSFATKFNYSNKPIKFGFDYFRKIDKKCLKNNQKICKYEDISIKEQPSHQMKSESKKRRPLRTKKTEIFYSELKLKAYKKYLKAQKKKVQRYDRSKVFEKNWGKKRRRSWRKIANNY